LVETSLLLTVSFGTSFVAVKHVVESVPPILFAAVRFSFAGVLLWLLLHLVEPESKPLSRKDFLPMPGLGVAGVTLT
jgi:drug/metabolite transporter (DMT)-like permease